MARQLVGARGTGRSVAAFDAAIDALLVFYASDVVCHPATGWVEDDVCHGHDGIRRLSAVWSANVEDPVLEVHDVRDLQERLLILAQLRGRDASSGEPTVQRFAALNSDLRPDGKVGDVRFFMSWEEALEAVADR